MALSAGRDFLLKLGSGSPVTYTTIAAARTNSITRDNTEVDATTMDDAGVRKLFATAGVRSTTISTSGLFTDSAGQAALYAAMDSGAFVKLSLENATNTLTIRGDFQVTSLEMSGDEGDMMTFSASFASAGAITTTNS